MWRVCLPLLSYAALSVAMETESTCATLPAEIHVTKEEIDDSGVLARTCQGDLRVTKCEGTCPSQAQPSVASPSGFLKECQCCKETWMREREILLTECYDQVGQRLYGETGTMLIRMTEPEACACLRCGS
ncbi:Bursb [Cordylochernes scorpioides]|uniref:Bursb n=1 Tax=Cordylochernes scorpioides TaxID=51811 RepID=A0ABY6KPS0_9ARAC|nr:Bursb [Cordylochernes scorpioides]